MISWNEAVNLVENTSKFKHSLFVSCIMAKMAKKLGENEFEWRIVGLLHDLDYDLVKGDMSKHGVTASRILSGKLSEEALYAIKAHDHRAGFTPRSLLDRSLIAADALANFTEDQGIQEVEGEEALVAKLDDESILKHGSLMRY